jgi:uncharacterized membrane protein YdjX (TVP38/TMEM64 family)
LPIKDWVDSALTWSRELGGWGAPMVAALFVPASVFMLPGSPIGIATGFAFDFPIALASVVLFSNLGAQAAFVIGRWLFRDSISSWVAANPKRQAVERAVSSQGFRVVFLLRLSPLIPFNALNYALSVSRVKFRSYALGTFLGMLPGSLLFVSVASALGAAGRDWSEGELDTGLSGKFLLGLGIATGFAAIGLVTKRAKALLAEELA